MRGSRDIQLYVFHRLNVILSISRIVGSKTNNLSLVLQLGRFESVVLTARFARVNPLQYVLWAAVKWGYEKGHYVSSPLWGGDDTVPAMYAYTFPPLCKRLHGGRQWYLLVLVQYIENIHFKNSYLENRRSQTSETFTKINHKSIQLNEKQLILNYI